MVPVAWWPPANTATLHYDLHRRETGSTRVGIKERSGNGVACCSIQPAVWDGQAETEILEDSSLTLFPFL